MKIDILEVCIMEQFLNYGSLHNYLAEMQIWQLKLRFENVKIERIQIDVYVVKKLGVVQDKGVGRIGDAGTQRHCNAQERNV